MVGSGPCGQLYGAGDYEGLAPTPPTPHNGETATAGEMVGVSSPFGVLSEYREARARKRIP